VGIINSQAGTLFGGIFEADEMPIMMLFARRTELQYTGEISAT
jgi:hypothetical protein